VSFSHNGLAQRPLSGVAPGKVNFTNPGGDRPRLFTRNLPDHIMDFPADDALPGRDGDRGGKGVPPHLEIILAGATTTMD
jgi:hypothetical protein